MKSSALKVLSESEIREIHRHGLDLLEHTGIRVNVKKMRHLLADHGCRVDESSRIVRFPGDVVEKYMGLAPREFPLCGPDPEKQWQMSPDQRLWSGLGTAIRFIDAGNANRRDAVQEDVRKHLVLFDHLPNITCNQMDIMALDIPMHTTHVELIRAWAHNCTKPTGMGAYGVMATTDMVEMVSMVMGGKDRIRDRHPFNVIVSIQSPLSTAGIQIEGLMILAENRFPCIMAPEAMAGTTAPVTLAGLLVQHNAEIVSHIVMAQVVNPGTPVYYGSVSTIADMRWGTAALGAVETGLLSVASAQLAHFYHVPCRAVAGATDSKLMDIQAGIEREQSMTLAALGGVNYITCVGTLESTNLGAHEMTVIDNEIIGRVERALRGIAVNDVSLALETIKHAGPDGNYLMEPHTQKHFRTEHFMPRVSDREQIEKWESAGRKTMVDHAAAAMEKILAEHQPRVMDPKLAAELDRYVETVSRRTVADFEAAEWEP
ncbi:trimethylamine methyltransferase family protein [bacterium]|nr:trimethylamine methyltransferase family protein [bacterium]